MHCLPAEQMSRLFVLLVVRPGESSLVTWLLSDACCTGVPIFTVESARESSILVCKLFHWVWDAWNTHLSALDHLGSAHVWHGYVVVSTISASASIVPIVVSPSIASSATAPTSTGVQTTAIPSTTLVLVVLLVMRMLLLLPVRVRLLHKCLIL